MRYGSTKSVTMSPYKLRFLTRENIRRSFAPSETAAIITNIDTRPYIDVYFMPAKIPAMTHVRTSHRSPPSAFHFHRQNIARTK